MRNSLLIALAAVACSCTTVYEAQGPSQPSRSNMADHTVLNNTRLKLDVIQDGKTVYAGLNPGQSIGVRPRLWNGVSCVSVTGYTAEGDYVGAANWAFMWNVPETWIVSSLQPAR